MNSPFYPFIKRLEWAPGIVRTDTGARKLDKLEGILQGSAETKREAAPLLAALLSIPFGERYPRLQINELVQKQRTMEVLEEQLVLLVEPRSGACRFRGCALDRSNLARADEQGHSQGGGSPGDDYCDLPPGVHTALVGSRSRYGVEAEPAWAEARWSTSFTKRPAARRCPRRLPSRSPPSRAASRCLSRKSRGRFWNPAIWNWTASVTSCGSRFDDFTIPSTLQDSLIARLDRLGSAKDVVLTASIIGREFSYELIEAISPVPQATLLADLERLVQSDLLGQRGAPPQSRYIFKHALIRDAAYQSVLKARKRELHQRIAEVLASRFPEVVETEPELLAHHYTEANVVDRALTYWRQAAERAMARMAHAEALGHVDKAKKLIAALPAGAEQDEWELAFLVIEGPLQMTLHGWESPQANRVYEAARVVAERLRRPAELFPALWGLWLGAHSSGQHARAHELYREMFDLLKQTNDPEYVVQANHAGCTQMLAEGLPHAALGHIEQLLNNYRFDRPPQPCAHVRRP